MQRERLVLPLWLPFLLDQSPIDRLAAAVYPYTEGQTFEKEERS
jgi:hypothetical protein